MLAKKLNWSRWRRHVQAATPGALHKPLWCCEAEADGTADGQNPGVDGRNPGADGRNPGADGANPNGC